MAERIVGLEDLEPRLESAPFAACLLPGAPAALRGSVGLRAVLAGLVPGSPSVPATGPLEGWRSGPRGLLALGPAPAAGLPRPALLLADGERPLRDLVRALPVGEPLRLGFGPAWIGTALDADLTGERLPQRVGHALVAGALADLSGPPARRLEPTQGHILAPVLGGDAPALLAAGLAAFVCPAGAPRAVAFARRADGGLPAVSGSLPLVGPPPAVDEAQAVVAAASAWALEGGQALVLGPTCAVGTPAAAALEALGFRPWFRLHACAGARGRAPGPPQTSPQTARHAARRGAAADQDADAVTLLREAGQPDGRARHGLFVAEGPTVAGRALEDRQAVVAVAHTAALERTEAGRTLLAQAAEAGARIMRVSDGVMGTITPTRPLPPVVAAVRLVPRDATTLHVAPDAVLLLAEDLQNPDNLGLVLRTADALGADAVVTSGPTCDPLHRQCVRAARGAVGRLPVFTCRDVPAWLAGLRAQGVTTLGLALLGRHAPSDLDLPRPLVIAVGNEQHGLSTATMDACDLLVRIAMAPGQDSLNVAVAAGLMLYEAGRQRRATTHGPHRSGPEP